MGEASRLVDAEAATALGRVLLVRRSWIEPIDVRSVPPAHWLELTLMPRPAARAGFPDRWGAHRFERIGALFLFPAGELVRARSECRRQSSIDCSLAPDALRAWFQDEIDWTDGRLAASLDIARPEIRSLLLRLGAEVRSPGFASGALVELMTAQLALELARYCLAADAAKTTGGLAPWRLRLIDERLADVHQGPSLDELAALCGLSVRQLTRAFRASRGCSLGDHIARSQADHARRLLAAGTPVKAVAFGLGFGSPSNFSAAFRRATGESPRSFRERVLRHRPSAAPRSRVH